MNMDGTQQEAPFLSTPSARRATACVHGGRTMLIISIHALREEGDRDFGVSELDYIQFLSTPSARRATWSPCRNRRRDSYFYPRPPRGGRRRHDMADIAASGFLSTPSARRATKRASSGRNSVPNFYPRPPRGGRLKVNIICKTGHQFLSTPSARRATGQIIHTVDVADISIHALREERDALSVLVRAILIDFYPRPPRGGRLEDFAKGFRRKSFLSTPSARRATAKTETKSLFSNKLYNILHEFRRALIYNGSKSYPNHAK